MTLWKFWPEKKFADVYENIYIRAHVEDWFNIIDAMAKELEGKTHLLDIGCGEGHTTKQILDRISTHLTCDLLEPDRHALDSAKTYLSIENTIGETWPTTLKEFQPQHKYDGIFTSHTNYYWTINEADYKNQLQKLVGLLDDSGKLLILTLPSVSAHYKILLHAIYPAFNYAEYIEDFYKNLGLRVRTEHLRMRIYVGDFFTTQSVYNAKIFYRFIHNQDDYPTDSETREFLKKISEHQEDGYLDFKDSLIVVEK